MARWDQILYGSAKDWDRASGTRDGKSKVRVVATGESTHS